MKGNPGFKATAASTSPTFPGKKSVLMIDYFFPPIGGPGVRRTLGFVKHLAEFGWSPIVLTVGSGDSNVYDYSLLEMIPNGIDVQRTASIEPLRFARRLLGRNVDQRNNLDRNGRDSGLPWRGPRWMSDVAKSLLFPDHRIGWLPFAVARALAASRVKRFDVIYSTSTSVTSHLIALVLKRILNKPWVADFQDPWLDSQFCSPGFRRTMGQRIENMILQAADRSTFASESARAAAQQKYGLLPRKSVTVLLGCDPDILEGIEPITRSKFTITHFGSFYGGRSPRSFLKALSLCIQEHPELAQEIEVLFFGSFDSEMMTQTEALLDKFDLRDIVHLAGLVPYTLGLRHLLSSDILLLIAFPGVDGHNTIPAKLFDYLVAERPILALLPEGEAAQIVRQANVGIVTDLNDAGTIRNFILERYQQWKEGTFSLPIDRAVVKDFTVRELTRQFVAILDDVLEPSL